MILQRESYEKLAKIRPDLWQYIVWQNPTAGEHGWWMRRISDGQAIAGDENESLPSLETLLFDWLPAIGVDVAKMLWGCLTFPTSDGDEMLCGSGQLKTRIAMAIASAIDEAYERHETTIFHHSA